MAKPKEFKVVGNQLGQHTFITDVKPGFSCYQGGWGAGKSWAGARKFGMVHQYNLCESLIVAPTMADVWRFCVPELQRVCEEWRWRLKLYQSGTGTRKFPHAILFDEIIYLMSAEDPKRFAGFEVGNIWGDEAARYKENAENPLKDAPRQIKGRLRNKRAKILHCSWTTTPEGTDTHIQRDFIDKPLPNHRIHYGSTTKNTAAPEQYKEMLSQMPEHLVQQYVDGIASNYTEGQAHPTFNLMTHVSSAAELVHAPIHIGCDFNVSPMCWVLFQDIGGIIRVFDEIVIEDFALVDNAMTILKDRAWHEQHGSQYIFHPDKSASNRSTTGESEFANIERLCKHWKLNYAGDAYGANPPITMRINNLSRVLKDGLGNSTMIIHPRCETLIENFQRTKRKSDGSYDPGSDGQWGHILDGLGYGIWDVRRPAKFTSFADTL